jgi:hypothetical protein
MKETVKSGQTYIKGTFNIQKDNRSLDLEEREFDDFDLESRDFSETVSYNMGPYGQYLETVDKKIGRPGGKFQETVQEVIKG